jgi:hypothetical protein
MKNIHVFESETACFFMGLPEMNLQNVSLKNSVFETKKGITAIDSDGLTLSNVKIIASNDYALTIYNSKNIKVSNFTFNESKSAVKILGPKTNTIHFDKKDFSDITQQIETGKNIPKNAVSFN